MSVGQPVARVDIQAKVTGGLTWVHDIRLPGMLHGRVVRPPYSSADSSAPLGNSLISVDESSIAHLAGIVKLVRMRDFIGIVAEREEQAIAAMRQLKVQWKSWQGLPDLSPDKLHETLSALPGERRVLRDDEGTDAALTSLHQRVNADYVWPYHMHSSIGPSCTLADVSADKAEVWSGTQNSHDLRKDLVLLLGRAPETVHINRMDASGCYGRNCTDDVSADAVILSQAVGRPVRVQLMREQEAGWEPKGTGQLIRIRGGLDEIGNVAAYELRTCYPSNGATTLPLVLTGKVANSAVVQQMGDLTAIPQYCYPHMRVIALDAAPIVRPSWMHGVSALPNVFPHECWIVEMAQKRCCGAGRHNGFIQKTALWCRILICRNTGLLTYHLSGNKHAGDGCARAGARTALAGTGAAGMVMYGDPYLWFFTAFTGHAARGDCRW